MTGGTRTAPGRRTLRETITLVCVLALVPLAPAAVLSVRVVERLWCADGELVVVGSALYAPILRQAADDYTAACPDSRILIDTGESAEGLQRLADGAAARDGSPELLAVSDGPRGHGLPHLREKLFASAAFSLVVNPEAGVTDLSRQQISDIHAGRITSWAQVGGNDVPISPVRHDDSTARRILDHRILGRPESAGSRCEDAPACAPRADGEVLRGIAADPGGLGCAEAEAAAEHPGVRPLRIDGELAPEESTDLGRYPLRQAGFAYVREDAALTSLATSFLNYLANNPSDR
ncbi:ABC-type phosphate transport system, substrate-binding protein [Saccharopolyspora kobensis]|uniref:ABC-type phosphate transport system, substrate-binding protein n=1 Tax=Saccharopolyspora kobensis TaxID=146035 RepID=A0A1H5ZTW9_9PSEU|nr:substrate-binding domain-containing protein [Saccharopolyspora kobensis]SEG39600.1 ABC-type phosphate transport system, substrate-binding protein [Saccharopolyspora kobensis]SFE14046.1 phosphate ABC transporter substrate-binding protein, PhoT family [Saccharopolyspora kobensis]